MIKLTAFLLLCIGSIYAVSASADISGLIYEVEGPIHYKSMPDATGGDLIQASFVLDDVSCKVKVSLYRLVKVRPQDVLSLAGRVEELDCLTSKHQGLFSGRGHVIGNLSEDGSTIEALVVGLWI